MARTHPSHESAVDDPSLDTDVAARSIAWRRWSVVLSFFGYCLALQLAWALIHPPYGISDEPAHVVKAVATSSGQLRGPEVVGQFDYPAMEYSVPEAYAGIWNFQCSDNLKQRRDCPEVLSSSRERVAVSSTAASYPPLYYTAVGWAGLPVPGPVGLYSMRFLTALLVSALAGCCCWIALSSSKPTLFMAALFVAFTAQVAAFGGSVNPQAPEIAAALLFWLGGVALAHGLISGDSERATQVLFVIATLAFSSIRPASFVWMVPSTMAILASSVEPGTWRQLWTDSARRFVMMTAAAGVALSAVWHVVLTRNVSLGGNAAAGGSLLSNLRISFDRSDEFFIQMFGFFGWTSLYPPMVVPILGVCAVVLLVAASGPRRSTWSRFVFGALLAAVVLSPTVLEGARAATSGLGFQGRYLLPLAMGVPILAVALGTTTSPSSRDIGLAKWSVLAGVSANAISVNHAARNFFVGLSGSYNWLTATLWSPPGGVILVLTLLVLALVASIVTWRSTVRHSTAEDHQLRTSSNGLPTPSQFSNQ